MTIRVVGKRAERKKMKQILTRMKQRMLSRLMMIRYLFRLMCP